MEMLPKWILFMSAVLELALNVLGILFFIEVIVFGIKIRSPKKEKEE